MGKKREKIMKARIFPFVAALAVLSLCVSFAAFARISAAEVKKLEVRDTDQIRDILTRNVGTPAKVSLRSGVELSGKVSRVHTQLVVISELAGREFFDAVVRIEEISAVIMQARDR